MTETSRLMAFLLALQTSQSVQNRYEKDPVAEMKRFDLSQSTIEAVQSGDLVTLWEIVAGPTAQVGHVVVVEKTHRRWKRKRK